MLRVRQVAARIWRLHPTTWCVTLLVVGAMVLIVVPGVNVDDDLTSSWVATTRKQVFWSTAAKYAAASQDSTNPHASRVLVYAHGWPRPCFLRSLGSLDTYVGGKVKSSRPWSNPQIVANFSLTGRTRHPVEISWSNRDNWPLESDHYRVHVGYLLLDCAWTLAVIGITGALVEWWIRSRGKLWRFRTLDLLLLLTVLSVGFGWYFHHLRVREVEDEIVTKLTSDSTLCGATQSYAGPRWLARLLGNQESLRFLHHYRNVRWHRGVTDRSREKWEEVLTAASRLTYLRSVSLPDGAPSDLLRWLAQQRRLKSVGFRFDAATAQQFLPKDAIQIHAHNLELLAQVNVYHFQLSGASVLEEDIDIVASLPLTTRISLHDVSATLDELEALGEAHPSVEFTASWGPYETQEPVSHMSHRKQVRKMRTRRERLRAIADGLPLHQANPSED